MRAGYDGLQDTPLAYPTVGLVWLASSGREKLKLRHNGPAGVLRSQIFNGFVCCVLRTRFGIAIFLRDEAEQCWAKFGACASPRCDIRSPKAGLSLESNDLVFRRVGHHCPLHAACLASSGSPVSFRLVQTPAHRRFLDAGRLSQRRPAWEETAWGAFVVSPGRPENICIDPWI